MSHRNGEGFAIGVIQTTESSAYTTNEFDFNFAVAGVALPLTVTTVSQPTKTCKRAWVIPLAPVAGSRLNVNIVVCALKTKLMVAPTTFHSAKAKFVFVRGCEWDSALVTIFVDDFVGQ